MFPEFFKNLLEFGLEYFGLFYGVYRAQVTEVDTENRGRIKVKVPSIALQKSALANWAQPNFPFTGRGYGAHFLPRVGDFVWVIFEGGKISNPVWIGGWYAQEEQPADMNGKNEQVYGVVTPAGHQILIDEANAQIKVIGKAAGGGEETFVTVMADDKEIIAQTGDGNTMYLSTDGASFMTKQGHVLAMDDEGIKAWTASGDMLYMKDGGPVALTSNASLSIKGSGQVHIDGGSILLGTGLEPMVKGQTLYTWLSTHVHTTTIPGVPTSPPVVPLPITVLTPMIKIG